MTALEQLASELSPIFSEKFIIQNGAVYKRNKSGNKYGKPLPPTEVVFTLSQLSTKLQNLSLAEQNTVFKYLLDKNQEQSVAFIETLDEWAVPILLAFRWFSDGSNTRTYFFPAWANAIAQSESPDESSLPLELTLISQDEDALATALQSSPQVWKALSEKYAQACQEGKITPKVKNQSTVYHCFRSYLIQAQKLWLSDIRFCLPYEPLPMTNVPGKWTLWYCNLKSIVTTEKKPTPAWDGWLAKLGSDDHKKVFKAWVFSIFVAKNKGRQLLWLHDNGGGGKSTIAKVLQRFMGHRGCGAVSSHLTDSEFGAASAYGKRLLIHPDNKNPRLLSSAVVHQIVAGDYIQINEKFQRPFSAYVHCKMLVMANCPPDADTYNEHESSRLIYLQLNPDAKGADKSHLRKIHGKVQLVGDPTFEDRLLEEFPSFLQDAMLAYKELCPTHGNIILPHSIIQETDTSCSSIEQDTFETIYFNNFDYAEGECILTSDVKQVFEMEYKGGNKSLQLQSFFKYLAVAHGHIKTRSFDQDGKYRRVIINIRPKGGVGMKFLSAPPEESKSPDQFIPVNNEVLPNTKPPMKRVLEHLPK